jgi:phosphate transport system permease protein
MKQLTRRRIVGRCAFILSGLATALGLGILAAILWTLLSRGFSALSLTLFTQMTPAPGSHGGLLNAIAGSVAMTGIAIAIGTPVGILAGIYLNEYGRSSRLSKLTRFVNDVLLSAPSIIVGLFVYTLVVVPMGHFSAIAGALALALIAVPVTVRTSEDMLRLIPGSLREASAALGAQPWRTITYVTALNNQFWSSDLGHPIANLPVVIFQFAMSPYQDWQSLAWAGASMITLFILALSIGARSLAALFGKQSRHSE